MPLRVGKSSVKMASQKYVKASNIVIRLGNTGSKESLVMQDSHTASHLGHTNYLQ